MSENELMILKEELARELPDFMKREVKKRWGEYYLNKTPRAKTKKIPDGEFRVDTQLRKKFYTEFFSFDLDYVRSILQEFVHAALNSPRFFEFFSKSYCGSKHMDLEQLWLRDIVELKSADSFFLPSVKATISTGELVLSKNKTDFNNWLNAYCRITKANLLSPLLNPQVNLAGDFTIKNKDVDIKAMADTDLILYVSGKPDDALRMSLGKFWSSCQNLYNGLVVNKLLPNVFDKNMKVAYLISKVPFIDQEGNKHPFTIISRRILRWIEQDNCILADRCYPDGVEPVFTEILQQAGYKVSYYNPGVYQLEYNDFKGLESPYQDIATPKWIENVATRMTQEEINLYSDLGTNPEHALTIENIPKIVQWKLIDIDPENIVYINNPDKNVLSYALFKKPDIMYSSKKGRMKEFAESLSPELRWMVLNSTPSFGYYIISEAEKYPEQSIEHQIAILKFAKDNERNNVKAIFRLIKWDPKLLRYIIQHLKIFSGGGGTYDSGVCHSLVKNKHLDRDVLESLGRAMLPHNPFVYPLIEKLTDDDIRTIVEIRPDLISMLNVKSLPIDLIRIVAKDCPENLYLFGEKVKGVSDEIRRLAILSNPDSIVNWPDASEELCELAAERGAQLTCIPTVTDEVIIKAYKSNANARGIMFYITQHPISEEVGLFLIKNDSGLMRRIQPMYASYLSEVAENNPIELAFFNTFKTAYSNHIPYSVIKHAVKKAILNSGIATMLMWLLPSDYTQDVLEAVCKRNNNNRREEIQRNTSFSWGELPQEAKDFLLTLPIEDSYEQFDTGFYLTESEKQFITLYQASEHKEPLVRSHIAQANAQEKSEEYDPNETPSQAEASENHESDKVPE